MNQSNDYVNTIFSVSFDFVAKTPIDDTANVSIQNFVYFHEMYIFFIDFLLLNNYLTHVDFIDSTSPTESLFHLFLREFHNFLKAKKNINVWHFIEIEMELKQKHMIILSMV